VPAEGAAILSIASILVVFFAFGVATVVLLWLMDVLVDALRWRIIDRRGRYPRASQSSATGSEGAGRPASGDAPEGARRPWWRRLLGG
jgi:hypothetical protein